MLEDVYYNDFIVLAGFIGHIYFFIDAKSTLAPMDLFC